jgi:hypothetical protein
VVVFETSIDCASRNVAQDRLHHVIFLDALYRACMFLQGAVATLQSCMQSRDR